MIAETLCMNELRLNLPSIKVNGEKVFEEKKQSQYLQVKESTMTPGPYHKRSSKSHSGGGGGLGSKGVSPSSQRSTTNQGEEEIFYTCP